MAHKMAAVFLICAVIICSTKADIWDDAAIIVEELQEIVNRAQNTAFAQTNALHQHIWTFAGNATNDGHAAVAEGKESIARQLDNLHILADVLGRPQCMEARHEELDQISDDISFDISDCIRWLEIGASSTVTNVSAYVYGAQEQVTFYRIRMDNCNRASEDVQCILNIIGEMELAKDELPTMILDEVLRVLLLVRTWESGMLTCAEHRVSLIYTEGQRIIFDVEQCLTAADPSPVAQQEKTAEEQTPNRPKNKRIRRLMSKTVSDFKRAEKLLSRKIIKSNSRLQKQPQLS